MACFVTYKNCSEGADHNKNNKNKRSYKLVSTFNNLFLSSKFVLFPKLNQTLFRESHPLVCGVPLALQPHHLGFFADNGEHNWGHSMVPSCQSQGAHCPFLWTMIYLKLATESVNSFGNCVRSEGHFLISLQTIRLFLQPAKSCFDCSFLKKHLQLHLVELPIGG